MLYLPVDGLEIIFSYIEKGGIIMNKLSKIFLSIIILLILALSVTTYYLIYYRNAYFGVANEMVRIVEENEKKSNEIKE